MVRFKENTLRICKGGKRHPSVLGGHVRGQILGNKPKVRGVKCLSHLIKLQNKGLNVALALGRAREKRDSWGWCGKRHCVCVMGG